MAPESQPTLRDALDSVRGTGEPEAYEVGATSPSGEPQWYRSRMTPIEEDGDIVGVVIVATNISELRVAQAETARLRSLLPLCAWCDEIHAEDGSWLTIEAQLGGQDSRRRGPCNAPLPPLWPAPPVGYPSGHGASFHPVEAHLPVPAPSTDVVGSSGADRSAALPFPFRAAAIDVGSNAIRYVLAEFTGADRWIEIESERLAVRLGKDVFTEDRRFTPETLTMGLEAMTHIRRRLDDLGVNHYRAVATSAVRESQNGGEFVERVRRESGIHLETISGSQEAHLVWRAAGSRFSFGKHRWFLVDLGGGSVEVSVVNQEGILWSESHTLGSVRLLQAVAEDAPARADYREILERYVHVLKIPRAVSEWRPVGALATGGNIEALARLGKAPTDGNGVATLKLDVLREVLSRLAALTCEERTEKLGLRTDRADVILPAAVVYERIAELTGCDEILVPGVGVREGVLLDLADDLRDHRAHRDRRTRELLTGAVALGRRYQFDEAHAKQVADLSLALFDQTAEAHGLGEGHRRVLLAAALLHDVGQFVSYRRHHKHSAYLIANSELPDVSPDEVPLVALVARYHRRAEPGPEHPEFAALPDDEQEAVRTLSALLRVADALDRGHVARVTSLRVRDEDNAVVLELRVRGGLVLEEWALRKKGRLFQKVFGRPVRLEARTGAEAGSL
jgi:exopolyphosphatase / guanosine-5'-triphosphate,3'-diphosphate pyrophosphatase